MTKIPRTLRPLSPMHDELEHAQPRSWGAIADMPVVHAFATPADEAKMVRKLAIADVSALARLTLKGPDAKDLLTSLGASVPESIFTVHHFGQGGLSARTGNAEFFIEDGPKDNLVARLHEVLGPFGDQKPGVYRVLRSDASMLISGELATEVFMQTCGYDFRIAVSGSGGGSGAGAGGAADKMVFTRVAGVSCSILPRTHRIHPPVPDLVRRHPWHLSLGDAAGNHPRIRWRPRGLGELLPADHSYSISTQLRKKAMARTKNAAEVAIQQAKSFLQENQVKFVLAQLVDIHGVAKAKAVPASHFEDILNDGAGFAGFALWGLGQEPHDPDYMAVGDLKTLHLVPYQPGFARIVCNGTVKKKPWAFDTRTLLMRQIERLAQHGWTLNTGLEPEFMVLAKNPDGSFGPADATDQLDKPCYDYKGLSRSRAFIEKLVESLVAVGIDVYQVDHEDANGQFEVNFTYSDALTSADRMIFFRMAAGEIAKEMGMICSFMPKPMSHRTGSGMHMHISMADAKGTNIFMDPSDKRNLGLSKLAYHFLGGLLKHAPALAAFCAPCVNSYKRLVVGRSLSGATWAPAFISYGDNNRTTMVRVPYGRLELRLTDSSANPYLATAAAIIAGLDGIEHKLDPGEPVNLNHYSMPEAELQKRGIGVLPQSLHEAIIALEADTLFHKALGEPFVAEFLRLKRMEWVEYHRHVSDWEVRRYLEFF